MTAVFGTSPGRPSILLLEDDPDILRLLKSAFESAGFATRSATSTAEALRSVRCSGPPSVAVVDLLLPGPGGLEFCREVHSFCDLPIVVLTSVTEARSAIAAIERYAEDYVRKPFDPAELVARVQRVLRRLGSTSADGGARLALGPHVRVELGSCVAEVDGARVPLTPTETKILHILSRHAGSVVPNELLLRRLWPGESESEDSLRVHVHRLRRKIERDPASPRFLVTERGVGYRLLTGGGPP